MLFEWIRPTSACSFIIAKGKDWKHIFMSTCACSIAESPAKDRSHSLQAAGGVVGWSGASIKWIKIDRSPHCQAILELFDGSFAIHVIEGQ